MSDMIYFVFRDDDGSLYGGPYRDEVLAKQMALTWAEADGVSATTVGVLVMYLARTPVRLDPVRDTPERADKTKRRGLEHEEG